MCLFVFYFYLFRFCLFFFQIRIKNGEDRGETWPRDNYDEQTSLCILKMGSRHVPLRQSVKEGKGTRRDEEEGVARTTSV